MKSAVHHLWTSEEADAITGGQSSMGWAATGICIKAEDVRPGDLFFAAIGDDLAGVFARGAAAAVAPYAVKDCPGRPVLRVDNVFEALCALGRAARFKTHATVLAVQGGTGRRAFSRLLSLTGSTHAGRRSMAFSLAGLPEDCDFGVFGFSPYIRPDIAVVTDGAAALKDPVFESMPDNGIVLIDADDARFPDVLAQARASGIRNIYTFGRGDTAEARIVDSVRQGEALRVNAKIFGVPVHFLCPADMALSAVLPGLMVTALSGFSLETFAARLTAHTWESLAADANFSLWDKAFMQKRQPGCEALFKVTGCIDWGRGRRTLMLGGAGAHLAQGVVGHSSMELPRRIENHEIVCAPRDIPVFKDAREAFRRNRIRTEDVVADVLMPGDLVMFRKMWKSSRAVFSGALRLINSHPQGVVKPDHAL